MLSDTVSDAAMIRCPWVKGKKHNKCYMGTVQYSLSSLSYTHYSPAHMFIILCNVTVFCALD